MMNYGRKETCGDQWNVDNNKAMDLARLHY